MNETMETRILKKTFSIKMKDVASDVKTPRIGWDGTNTRG